MTAPVGSHIAEALKAMWYPVVQLLFIWIRFRIGFTDTFCDNLGVTFFMTRILAIFALHTRRILEKVPA